ncbi:MAG: hypothetical protein E7594_06470 [Ruminococcaceae bacterium]|nr:hypothetical protein [Oscillospiraceae bacterium]
MSVQSQNVSQLIKDCKRRARVLLDTDHNRLWLILALGLWLATAGFIYMLGGALVYAADDSVFTEQPSVLATVLLIASYALMLLLAFLLLVPMSGGVIHVSEQIFKGERVHGRDLFYAFGSFGQYVRCMRAGLRSLGFPIISIAAILLTSLLLALTVGQMIFDMTAIYVFADLAFIGIILAGLALCFLVFFLFRRAFVAGVLIMRGLSRKEIKAQKKELCRGRGGALLGYHLGFFGWVVLAVATVLVSAMVDTVPYLLLCNQMLCDALKSQEIQNDN